ncbi:MAG: hypothetical protein HRT61_09010 [Ekhidna sp.]|nr:hypothetical protein [Ekhidna sp.]
MLAVLECQSQTPVNSTLEVVTFQLKSGISKEEAVQKLSQLNEIVRAYPGFIERSFAVNEEGQWTDIVLWTSKSAALGAAKDVATNHKAAAVFEIIDEESIQMNHYEIINTFKR